MANPNIVNVSSILGKVAGQAVTTSATAIVSNAAASGTIVKINSLIVSNIDGTNAADVSVYLYKLQTQTIYLASTISVPANSTLVVLSKDTSIYLEENDSIRAFASAAGDLNLILSYEIIT